VYATCARARDALAKRNNGREIDEGEREREKGSVYVYVRHKYGQLDTASERKKKERRRLIQVESCNLFPMAPVPGSVVTTLQSPRL